MEEVKETKERKEYTAFGVTGGIGIIIGVFIILLFGKYVFWANLPEFIKFIKGMFGG